ncbi:MAG: hypothetical protein V2I45_10560, partial [Halieaceae bacterium]|nr:hypothetical protein [Halieaceae bacterium]
MTSWLIELLKVVSLAVTVLENSPLLFMATHRSTSVSSQRPFSSSGRLMFSSSATPRMLEIELFTV